MNTFLMAMPPSLNLQHPCFVRSPNEDKDFSVGKLIFDIFFLIILEVIYFLFGRVLQKLLFSSSYKRKAVT